jgi:hypothetical protein
MPAIGAKPRHAIDDGCRKGGERASDLKPLDFHNVADRREASGELSTA